MFITRRPNGFYYIVIDSNGKRKHISCQTKIKRDAFVFLRNFDVNSFVQESHTEASLTLTLSEFAKEYLEYSPSIHAPHSTETCRTVFREFIRIVGDLKLIDVKPRIIDKFLAAKHLETSAVNVRRYYVTLAAAFELAKKWEYIDRNAFREVKRPKVAEVIPAYFTIDEFRRLVSAIQDDQLKSICLFAVNTGMRLGEIMQLKWTDIDLPNRKIIVANSKRFTTKSKKNRTIPINDFLWKLLSEHNQKVCCEYLFHQQGKPIREEFVSKCLKKYIRSLQLNDRLCFHSFRHTFASWLVQQGVSIYEVQKLLGHSDIKTTMIYSHLAPETLHSTVNKINLMSLA